MRAKTSLVFVALLIGGALLMPAAAAQTPSPTDSSTPSGPPSDVPSAEPTMPPSVPDDQGSPSPKPKKPKSPKPDSDRGSDRERNPKGNNGTIKIEDMNVDDIPQNSPHPGCEFQIEFYNYDHGNLHATYTFDGQAPSGGGEIFEGTTFIGEDEATGGRDLDQRVHVDLVDELAASDAVAHPKQGYHIKLTVHAEGSIGADVKHKVFWLEKCEDDVLGARLAAERRADVKAARAARAAEVAAAGLQRGAVMPFTGPADLLGLYAALGFALMLLGLLLTNRKAARVEG